MTAAPLLDAAGITVRHARRGAPPLVALDDVSLAVGAGEALGVIGESGSGKTTLARVVLGLQAADRGRVGWQGTPLGPLPDARRRALAGAWQAVFQDPAGSLDPRWTVLDCVAEPLRLLPTPLAGREQRDRAAELLSRVGVPEAAWQRTGRELSGGQAQRVALARALVTRPQLLVCDEATSALDVLQQQSIVALLQEWRAAHGMALLMVSHQLHVVAATCDRLLVLQAGRCVETGSTRDVLGTPQSSYTRRLVAAVPAATPAAARQQLAAWAIDKDGGGG